MADTPEYMGEIGTGFMYMAGSIMGIVVVVVVYAITSIIFGYSGTSIGPNGKESVTLSRGWLFWVVTFVVLLIIMALCYALWVGVQEFVAGFGELATDVSHTYNELKEQASATREQVEKVAKSTNQKMKQTKRNMDRTTNQTTKKIKDTKDATDRATKLQSQSE